jgi:hypothetical protein
MKPITADSFIGRVLLALRAGPITAAESEERWPGNKSMYDAVRLKLVEKIGDEFRLTEAGRAACPYRNPLAAPGVVQPYIFQPESTMPRENIVTRQQVLAEIQAHGQAGITKSALVAKFEHLVGEPAITSHLVMLKKDDAVSNPSRGLWVSTPTVNPKNEPKTESPAVVAGDSAVAKQQLIDMAAAIDLENLTMPPEAFETIEIQAVPDRRAPLAMAIDDEGDFEVGIFSDGTLNLVIDDGLQDAVIEFSPPALAKLRRFLGRVQEAA